MIRTSLPQRRLLLIALALLVLVLVTTQVLGPVRLVRERYEMGEQVRIHLDDLPEGSSVRIRHNEEIFRYAGSLNRTIAFTPPVAGEYEVMVVRPGSGAQIESHFFYVEQAPTTSTGAHPRLSLSTERISAGDALTIAIEEPAEGMTLTLVHEGFEQRYLGRLDEPIELVPELAGEYYLALRVGQEVVDRGMFVVEQPIVEAGPADAEPEQQDKGPHPAPKPPIKRTFTFRDHAGAKTAEPIEGERYTLEVPPIKRRYTNLTFTNLRYDPRRELKLDEAPARIVIDGEPLVNTMAIDPSRLDYDAGILTRIAEGTALYKCTLWDFDRSVCLDEWRYVRALTPGETYTINLTPEDPAFGEELLWWNETYTYRRQINLSNIPPEGLEKGYEVVIDLDTRDLVTRGAAQDDLDDLRVLWYNESDASWVERNREITLPNRTDSRIWFRLADDLTGAENYSYFLYYGNANADDPPQTPDIVLNLSEYTVSSYGGGAPSGQDLDPLNYSIENNSRTLHLFGNTWKAIDLAYTVTEDTILELDFRNRYSGNAEQEINSIGFEDDTSALSTNLFYQLYGMTNFGWQYYHNYTSPNWTHYTINVSLNISTGSYTHLTFGSDEDSEHNGAPIDVPDGWFSNIILREKASRDPILVLGEEIYRNIELPSVTLTSPANASFVTGNDITFNCSVESFDGQDLVNVTLYHNLSGNFSANETQTFSGGSDTAINATFTLTGLSDGSILWNCKAQNEFGNKSFAEQNYTVSLDNDAPAVTIHNPSNLTKDTTPTINVSISEMADRIWYRISGGPITQVCTLCEQGWIYDDIEAEGSYTLTVYANDTAGNQQSNTSQFTIDMNQSYHEPFADNSSIAALKNMSWQPGSVYFTGSSTRMFSENFTDENVSDGSPLTWVEVNEGGEDPTADWDLENGTLRETGNALDASANRDTVALGTFQYVSGLDEDDINLTAMLRATDNDGMGVMFRYVDQDDYYRVRFEGTSDYARLESLEGGNVTVLDSYSATDGGLTQGKWVEVRVLAFEQSISVYLNGTRILEASDSTHDSGSIALYAWGMNTADFDNITLDALGTVKGSYRSTKINTTDYISALTINWSTNRTDENNSLDLYVSVDGGTTWFEAQQGVEINESSMSGFVPDQSLAIRANVTSTDWTPIQLTSLNITWKEEDVPPYVVLISPDDGEFIESGTITFNCTATDNNDLTNITLYHNISGVFGPNESKQFYGGFETEGEASFTLTDVSDGSFIWTCAAEDNASFESFAAENRSIRVDTRTLSLSQILSDLFVLPSSTVTVSGLAQLSDLTPAANSSLDLTLAGAAIERPTLLSEGGHETPWWNLSWHYRIPITLVFANDTNDYPIAYPFNASEILQEEGISAALDNESIRVVEYESGAIAGERASQFDQASDYDNTTNAAGEVIWVVNGTANGTRTYHIYFDTTDAGTKPDSGHDRLRLFHEGFEEDVTLSSYQGVGGSQDSEPNGWGYNESVVYAGERALHITGNAWKRQSIGESVLLNENSTMTVAIYIPKEAELEGVGLDNSSDNTGTTELDYIFGGCQNSVDLCQSDFGEDIERYLEHTNSTWRILAIPVGADWSADNGDYHGVDGINYLNDDDNAYNGSIIIDEVSLWSVSVNWTNQTPSSSQGPLERLFATNSTGGYRYGFTAPASSGVYEVATNLTYLQKSAASATDLTVDGDSPGLSLNSPEDGANISAPYADFKWTATDAHPWVLCNLSVDGDVIEPNINTSTSSQHSEPVSGFKNGTHNWSVRCQDSLGNSVGSETREFSIDVSISMQIKVNNSEYTRGKIVNISINVTDRDGEHVNSTVYTKVVRADIEVDWWNENWSARRPYRIVESAARDHQEYVFNLSLDTEELINNGTMLSDCSDLRLISDEGEQLDFWIDDNPTYGCDSETTTIWVELDGLAASDTRYVFAYYGNAAAMISAQARNETFSSSSLVPRMYVVDSFAASTSTVSVSSFFNNTRIKAGSTSFTQNEGDADQISSGQLSQSGAIYADKPIYVAHDGEGDTIMPLAFAGETFVYRIDRSSGSNVNTFHVFAPFNDSFVQILYGEDWNNSLENLSVSFNSTSSSTQDTPDNVAVFINASAPVLIFHAESGDGDDAFPLYPIGTDWWGVPSNNIEIAALYDDTSITIYWNDSSTPTEVDLDAGEQYTGGGLGVNGRAPAAHVVADKPIGVSQIADQDGGESTTFLPEHELAGEYLIPHSTTYVTIAATQPSTSCSVYNSTGGEIYSATSGSNSRPRPNQLYFGDDENTNIPAGSRLVCDKAVFAYAEYDFGGNDGQEQNLWNVKQYRNYWWPAPIVTTLDQEKFIYSMYNDTEDTGFIIHHNTSLYDYGTYFAWAESLPAAINIEESESGDQESGEASIAASGNTVIGEAGRVNTSNFQTQQITFQNAYAETPVMLAVPATENTADDNYLIPLFYDVSTTGANVTLCQDQGASTCDATYSEESIHYFAFDASAANQFDWIEVSTITATTNGADTAITFNKTFSNSPRVWASANTYSQAGTNMAATAWVDDIDTTGANLLGCTHQGTGNSCDGSTPSETYGYVAIDVANHNISTFDSDYADISNSQWTSDAFTRTYTAPRVMVTQNDDDGGEDPQYPWARNVDSSGLDFRYCEQDAAGVCHTHTSEIVVWFAVEEGDIIVEDVQLEQSTDYTTYEDVMGGLLSDLVNITINLTISAYDNAGTTQVGNSEPDLQLQMATADNSSWVTIGTFNISGTGIASITTNQSTVIEQWENPSLRDLRVRGINFDYHNDTVYDIINWTGLTVTIRTEDRIGTASNHTSWRVIDDSPPSIENLSASPDPVGFGYSTNLSVDVSDETAVGDVIFNITYPDGTFISVEPEQGGTNTYWYLFNDTWVYGDHEWVIDAVDVSGQSASSTTTFFVGADAAISVVTEQDGYGANTDVYLIGEEDDSGWWNQNYEYRQAVTIAEQSGSALGEVHINLTVDTETILSQGRLRSDCYDIRFTDENGSELPYYRADHPRHACGTNQTLFYLLLDLAASETETIYMYFDYPSASDASDSAATFNFSTAQSLYYVVSNYTETGNLDVASFADENTITHNANTLSLNSSDTGSFSSAQILQGGAVSAPRAFFASGDADATDAIAPLLFASTEFAVTSNRYENTWQIYAPYADADVCFYGGSDGTLSLIDSCVSVTAGSVENVVRDVSDIAASTSYGAYINATEPVIITHSSTTGGTHYDSFVLTPPAKRLYGVPTTDFEVAAIRDNTNVKVYRSNGSYDAYTLNQGEGLHTDPGGSLGDGPGYYIEADKPVFAAQIRDGNGGEETLFLGDTYLAKEFFMPHGYDYITVAGPNITTCERYGANGNYIDELSVTTTLSPPYPAQGLFSGRTSGIGDRIICEHPVWIAYQEYSTDDERNAWGHSMYRKLARTPPSITFNATENRPSESKLTNVGSYNFIGYLLMRVQRYTGGAWVNDGIPVVDDLTTDTPRTFTSGSTRYLNTTWADAGAWNTQLKSAGKRRVYAALYDPEGNLLNISASQHFESYYNFSILEVNLTIRNITHENLYDHDVNEYEVEDIIDWVNITAYNDQAEALNVSIDLSLLNPDGTLTGWGPDSTLNCGDMAPNATCTKRWDNSSNGYAIPYDAVSGTYTLAWDVIFRGTNFEEIESTNFTFNVHRLPDNFSSSIAPSKVNRNESAIYEFGMLNLWAANLTSVNVSVNCPDASGISCACMNGTGETCQRDNIGERGFGSWWNQTYLYRQQINITNNEASQLDGGYTVNVTIDTASLYADEKVQLDCEDLRIVHDNGTALVELDRHLTTGCNETDSVFWFKLQDDIAASGSDDDYYAYYGNPAATSPLTNYSNVYVFYDDFDDGDIDGWQDYGSGDVVYRSPGGDGAIMKDTENDPDGGYATFPETLEDFEVIYNFNRPNENGGAQSRYGIEDANYDGYGFRITDVNPSGSFTIEERDNGGRVGDVASTTTSYFALNTWYIIRQRKLSTTHNITIYNSSGSKLDSIQGTDSTITSGFDRFVIHGGNEFYTDDIRVRHLVEDEPTVTPSTEESRSDVLSSGYFPQFNISTSDSTPIGNYIVSVNVTYHNPGGETRTWTIQQPQLLKVTQPGIIVVNLTSNFTSVTRTVAYDFSGYANNTNAADAINVELGWGTPYGWVVEQGSETTTDPTLASGEYLWNNATIRPNASSTLGLHMINLSANSSNIEGETDAILLNVWAAMNITLRSNNTDPYPGSTIRLNATVWLDNATPLSGRVVAFRDNTTGKLLGSNTSDAEGIAYLTYDVPTNATFGVHLYNASISSVPSKFYRSGYGVLNITIRQPTTFNTITDAPDPVGLGEPISISANITDADGIVNVSLHITDPTGSTSIHALNGTNDTYQHTHTETWTLGIHNYTFHVLDNTSDVRTSSEYTFIVSTQAGIALRTQFDNYSQNQQVNLSGYEDWWNESFLFRKQINLSSSYNGSIAKNTTVHITLDTQDLISGNRMQADADDLRIVWYNESSNVSIELDRIVLDENTNESEVWFTTVEQLTESASGYYIYYACPDASSPPTGTSPFTYYTRMVGSTVNGDGGDMIMVPFYNNTEYAISGGITASGTLDEDQTFQRFTLPSADNTYTIRSTKPLSIFTGVLEGSNPNAWTTVMGRDMLSLDTEFRVWSFSSDGDANIGAVWLVATGNDTEYEIRDHATGSLLHNGTLDAGEFYKDASTAGNASFDITLSKPGFVVTGKEDTPSGRDAQRWWVGHNGTKLDTVIWGISNNNDGLRIYNPDDAYVSVSIIDETDGTDSATGISVAPRSSLYRSLSSNEHVLRLVATAPILVDDKYVSGTNRQADSGDYVPDADYGHHVGQRFYVHATGASTADQYAAVWALFDDTEVFQNGASLTTIANRGSSYTWNPPLDSTVNVTADKPILFLFFTDEGGTDYAFHSPEIHTSWQGAPNATFGEEESNPSRIFNHLGYDFRGYLHMEVQGNTSEGWVTREVILSDDLNGSYRTIEGYRMLDLADLWLDAGAFDTATREDGVYRVYAELRDVSGSTMSVNNGTPLNATYLFRIQPARVNIDMDEIRIYDVTYSGNRKLDTTDLVDSGLNKTFVIYTNHTYRFEIFVNSLSNSDNWSINESNVTHSGLNTTWPIDETNGIFYYIGEDEYTGGNDTGGNVSWNTSLGGKLLPSSSIGFRYIMEVGDEGQGLYPIHFEVEGSDFGEEDRSVLRLVGYEVEPPYLFNGIYNITRTSLNRGESTLIYARWNEEILTALANYNSTDSSLENHTITLPDPNPQNWTNYTIATNSSWRKGHHAAKIYASDLVGNLNDSLEYFGFDVYALLSLNASEISPNPLNISDVARIGCQVVDDGGTPIPAYNVTFYNGSGLLGTNVTGATGWSYWNYNDTSAGVEEITCSISADMASYYNTSDADSLSQNLTTREFSHPWASDVAQSATVIHKLENITYFALWHDNFQLASAWLATEQTGSLTNNSLAQPIELARTQDWSNFTIQYPASSVLGLQRWAIYANDTSGNSNTTGLGSVYVWGWAVLSDYDLDPSSMIVGNKTTMRCRVIDNATQSGIDSYTVSFYNSTGLISTNTTGADGWASLGFVDNSLGQEWITCNITHDRTRYFNVTDDNEGSERLNTLPPGSDIHSPIALEYYLTSTSVLRGSNTTIAARWDEQILSGEVYYDDTSAAIEMVNLTGPFTNNWTNYTLETNGSWVLGPHQARIVARDIYNNTNDTLEYLAYNITGTSQISWLAPTTDVPQSGFNLQCNVTDEQTGAGISGYPVYFYDESDPVGSASTNAQGIATLWVDGSGYSGNEEFTCRIYADPSLYYSLGTPFQAVETVYVDGVGPVVELNEPENGSSVPTADVQFNFTATDNRAANLTCNLTLDGAINQSNISVSEGVDELVTIMGLDGGLHWWNVTCVDEAGNANTSQTWNFTVVARDLMVNESSIYYNVTQAIENQSVTVYGIVYNRGGSNHTNVTVQFYRGDPDAGGVQIGTNKTINITTFTSETVNETFLAELGFNNIYILVDPDNKVDEASETNNKAYGTLTVGLWHYFGGRTHDQLLVRDAAFVRLFTWNVSNATGSNVFAADIDSILDFTAFQSIGLDVDNNTVDDDFTQIDTQINSSGFDDSVETTYSSAGSPKETKDMTIFGRPLSDVPIVNSTNTTSFKTGILWDTSDGSFSYNGSQDIAFITQTNESRAGFNGTLDFEIRVPASLRDYTGAQRSVVFYTEIP